MSSEKPASTAPDGAATAAAVVWRLQGYRWMAWRGPEAASSDANDSTFVRTGSIRYSLRSILVLTTLVAVAAALVPRSIWEQTVGRYLVAYSLLITIQTAILLAIASRRYTHSTSLALLIAASIGLGYANLYGVRFLLQFTSISWAATAALPVYPFVARFLVVSLLTYLVIQIVRQAGYVIARPTKTNGPLSNADSATDHASKPPNSTDDLRDGGA